MTLSFTGERFLPECAGEMVYEHWHRYLLAQRHVAGKRVLDAASGEGYGLVAVGGQGCLCRRHRCFAGSDPTCQRPIRCPAICVLSPPASRRFLCRTRASTSSFRSKPSNMTEHEAFMREIDRLLARAAC